MPPLILDIVVDEQGQPVHQRSAQAVEQDILVGGSPLSPAESLPMQGVIQRETQAFHAVQALNPIATQAANALHLLHSPTLADFQWQKNIAAKAQVALLTEKAQFQKMWSAMAEEKARFQQFQKELWTTALPLIESRWQEDNERAQRLAASFQPLIDLRWQEERERLWGTQEQQQSLSVHLSQLADINELMCV